MMISNSLVKEIQSLARGLRILELLSADPDGVRITDIAGDLQIDKGSASRLARTLAAHGFARRNPQTRRYELGPRVHALSRTYIQQSSMIRLCHPLLEAHAVQTTENAHLDIPVRDGVLTLDQVESKAALEVNSEVGSISPSHCTAAGKIFLTHSVLTIPVHLEAYTSRTICDPEALGYHLQQVRERGYAIEDEEYHFGVRSIAAPVHDQHGRVAASLCFSGTARRITLENIPVLAQPLLAAAASLSADLGFQKP